jgi:hypothetical protein
MAGVASSGGWGTHGRLLEGGLEESDAHGVGPGGGAQREEGQRGPEHGDVFKEYTRTPTLIISGPNNNARA